MLLLHGHVQIVITQFTPEKIFNQDSIATGRVGRRKAQQTTSGDFEDHATSFLFGRRPSVEFLKNHKKITTVKKYFGNSFVRCE